MPNESSELIFKNAGDADAVLVDDNGNKTTSLSKTIYKNQWINEIGVPTVQLSNYNKKFNGWVNGGMPGVFSSAEFSNFKYLGTITTGEAGSEKTLYNIEFDGNVYSVDSLEFNASITSRFFEIIYNANDGSETPATLQSVALYGEQTILDSCKFEREGYKFIGWALISSTENV